MKSTILVLLLLSLIIFLSAVTYSVGITSTPIGEPIFYCCGPHYPDDCPNNPPNCIATGYLTPHEFFMEEGTSAIYAVKDSVYAYSWTPRYWSTGPVTNNLTHEFVGTLHDGIITRGIPEFMQPPLGCNLPGVTIRTPANTEVNIPYDIYLHSDLPVLLPHPEVNNSNTFGIVLYTFDIPVIVDSIIVEIPPLFPTLPPFTVDSLAVWWIKAFFNGAWHHATPYPYIGYYPGVVVLNLIPLNQPVIITISHIRPDPNTPVQLSSFTAIQTAGYFVNLQWSTATETNLSGYYIYRNTEQSLSSSNRVSSIIAGTNTSQTTNYSYTDMEVETGSTYFYWLEALDFDGTMEFYGPISITLNQPGGNPDTPDIPLQTCLLSVFPNPFNPSTSIPYYLKSPETVQISIYNSKGQLIKSYQRTHTTTGYFSLNFDGTDAQGNALASGIYHCIMKAGKYTSSTKMVLLK